MRKWSPMRFFAALGAALLTLAGCGGGVGTVYPVEGKVTVDGKPLPFGRITFVADKEKGNETKFAPFGEIKDDSYSLTTKGKTRAPAGWYNIMVVTQWPGAPPNPVELPTQYSDPGKSKLSVEVVPSPEPGRYDLKLNGAPRRAALHRPLLVKRPQRPNELRSTE
jgi:hypothetical protein